MEHELINIPRAHYKHWSRRLSTNNYIPPISYDYSFCLPPELLWEILCYLAHSQASLYNVSLVCRQWFLCATPLLYKHPKIYNTYAWATFLLTLNREKRIFQYGDLLQSIDLSCRYASNYKIKQLEDERKAIINTHIPLSTTNEATLHPNDSDNMYNIETANNNAALSLDNNLAIRRNTTGQGRLRTSRSREERFYHEPTAHNINDTHYHHHHSDNNSSSNNEEEGEGIDQSLYQYNNNNDQNVNNEAEEEVEGEGDNDDEVIIYNENITPIIVTTSSLIQLSRLCPRLVTIDLSNTRVIYDTMIEETGEYISTLQRYAFRPELTHVRLTVEKAIKEIGKNCQQLKHLKIQHCEWVTSYTIWLWASSCPHLMTLDARRSVKCSVKRLITNVIQVYQPPPPPSSSFSTCFKKQKQPILNNHSSSLSSSSQQQHSHHHNTTITITSHSTENGPSPSSSSEVSSPSSSSTKISSISSSPSFTIASPITTNVTSSSIPPSSSSSSSSSSSLSQQQQLYRNNHSSRHPNDTNGHHLSATADLMNDVDSDYSDDEYIAWADSRPPWGNQTFLHPHQPFSLDDRASELERRGNRHHPIERYEHEQHNHHQQQLHHHNHEMDLVGRIRLRLTSMRPKTHRPTIEMAKPNQSLSDFVWSILKEAKEQGLLEVSWVHS